MCISLEVDDDPEYADRAAARSTRRPRSRRRGTSAASRLDDRATFASTPSATPTSATTRSPRSTRSTGRRAASRPSSGPPAPGRRRCSAPSPPPTECAGRDVIVLDLVGRRRPGRDRGDRHAGEHDRRVAGRSGRHAHTAGSSSSTRHRWCRPWSSTSWSAEPRRRAADSPSSATTRRWAHPKPAGCCATSPHCRRPSSSPSVRRFRADGSRASRRLRVRDRTVAALYDDRGRIEPSTTDTVRSTTSPRAWWATTATGTTH